MSENKVWFITGASSGFGKALAEEVLAKGDRVLATARKPEVLQDLIEKYPDTVRAVKLDVTNLEDAKNSVREAVKEFGRIDVLVNNAGYALVGAIEETSDEQIRQQFDTNVFGVLNVTREVLPVLREQKSGHIVNIGSVVGISASPSLGIYSATKFALEGLSEALAGELTPHGIKTTIVEPGPFSTNGFESAVFAENPLPNAYPSPAQLAETFQEFKRIAGDPVTGGMCSGNVCEKMPVAQATVSHHLKELTEADLITPRSEGQFKYFTANSETMNEYISELQNRLKLKSK